MTTTANRGVFKAGRVLAPDSKWTGEEPEWHNWQDWTVEKFMTTRRRMLNFYNYYLSTSDMKPAVLDFMLREGYPKSDIAAITSANPNVMPSTIGKLIRAMDRGMPSIHPDAQDYYDKLPFTEGAIAKDDKETVKKELSDVLQFVQSLKTEDSKTEKNESPKMSVFDRIKIKVEKEVISHLDEMLDKWDENLNETPVAINLISLIRDNGIPANGCQIIRDWINRHLEEYKSAYSKSDSYLTEAYSYLKRIDIKNRIKAMESLLGEVNKYASVKKAQRAPRIKKTKDASKQISKLKYQQNSQDYNIDSISPLRIPSAQRLYVFNTKYRALSVYYAKGSGGFEIKGTSLINFDEDASFTITLRKPNDTLPHVLGHAIKPLDKLFISDTLKKKPATGRLNEFTLLLRVIESKH
jgi:hypothetical protein